MAPLKVRATGADTRPMGLFRRRPAPRVPAAAAPQVSAGAGVTATLWRDATDPVPHGADAPSAPLRSLAASTLEHALRSVVPQGGPLIPFSVLETTQGRSLDRFAGELSESHRRSRAHVRTAVGAVRAAIAWDGYLTSDSRREDAVFVEASEAGGPSVILAHRYRESPDGAVAVGAPVLVGSGEPLL